MTDILFLLDEISRICGFTQQEKEKVKVCIYGRSVTYRYHRPTADYDSPAADSNNNWVLREVLKVARGMNGTVWTVYRERTEDTVY